MLSSNHFHLSPRLSTMGQDRTLYMRLGARNDRLDRDVAGGIGGIGGMVSDRFLEHVSCSKYINIPLQHDTPPTVVEQHISNKPGLEP